MGALRVSTRAFSFIKILILARLLLPSEFGLFGVAMFILTLLEIITETGVNIFLIQEKSNIDKFIDTAWVVSIIRGILISLVLIIISPYIAIFFKVPQAKGILLFISVTPFIRGFINPSIVKFQKNLAFSKEFIFRLFIYGIDAVVAIAFGLRTHSAMSLVYGLIAGALLEVILSYFMIKPWPKFMFSKEKLKEVLARGKWVTAAGFFNYAFENFDDAAVGRLLNATSLGIYQMAYKITSLPMTEISDVIQKVTFPIYTRISDDSNRLKSAYIKSIAATALIVIPIGIILFIYPETLVRTLLGEKWLAAIGIIKIMAFYGVIRSLIEASYPLFLSLQKQKYVSLITFSSVLTLFITIVPLVKRYNMVGAGISGILGSIVAIPVTLFLLNKALKK